MAKTCLNHKDQTAVTMCHQCHKPLCKSCTMVTSHGSFCSSECSILFREFREKMKAGGPQKSGAGKKLVFFILLLVAAVILIHLAATNGVEIARKFDILGRLLEGSDLPSIK
jgi:hypothetical protein